MNTVTRARLYLLRSGRSAESFVLAYDESTPSEQLFPEFRGPRRRRLIHKYRSGAEHVHVPGQRCRKCCLAPAVKQDAQPGPRDWVQAGMPSIPERVRRGFGLRRMV